MKNIRRTIQKLQIHTLLTHTLVTLPLTQPLHTNYLPHASPNSNYTPDQSWPKPNWTDPIYALKMPSWGCKTEATSCSTETNLMHIRRVFFTKFHFFYYIDFSPFSFAFCEK